MRTSTVVLLSLAFFCLLAPRWSDARILELEYLDITQLIQWGVGPGATRVSHVYGDFSDSDYEEYVWPNSDYLLWAETSLTTATGQTFIAAYGSGECYAENYWTSSGGGLWVRFFLRDTATFSLAASTYTSESPRGASLVRLIHEELGRYLVSEHGGPGDNVVVNESGVLPVGTYVLQIGASAEARWNETPPLGQQFFDLYFSISPIPEPATTSLLAVGALTSLLGLKRKPQPAAPC